MWRVKPINAATFLGFHLAVITSMLYVPATRGAIALAFALYLVRMFGITAGYHRYFSHRSFKTSRGFQFFLALLGTMAAQKGVLWWAAEHRHHHRHSDTSTDRHSPLQHGLLWSHVGWFLSSKLPETDLCLIQDLTKYPELKWLNRNHLVPPLATALLAWGLLGFPGLVWGFGMSTLCCWHATYCINSLSHLIGTRRFATSDNSRNSFLLALLTLGEGWHNNHHRYPSSARQGIFVWEIDLTYYLLYLLARLQLVWDLRGFPDSAYGNDSHVRDRRGGVEQL